MFTAVAAFTTTLAFKVSEVLPIGSALPKADHKMMDISGKEITMEQVAKGHGLLVMFSCNTCPYVIRNQQRTKAVCKYAQQNNIGVILLNSNEAQRDDDSSDVHPDPEEGCHQ